MNLETALEPRLWSTVRASLEARKFTAAILDAIHLLTDVIRERSGVDGDGVALIGQAFGGSSPKLKINRLQTESEHNAQKGFEAMLRGLYQGVRNPRSHDAHEDSERDANTLILFVDYLLRVVEESGSPFSLPALVARVLDPDFVPSERYANLLVAEIPANKRLATCREVFGRQAEADAKKVKLFFTAILAQMSADNVDELCNLVSVVLRETTEEEVIRFVLGAFPSTIWPKLDEIARLRIENKLIASVQEGKWHLNRCVAGGLGAWATEIIEEFTLKNELWRVVFYKLDSADRAAQDYAINYFMTSVRECYDAPSEFLIRCVNKRLKAGDARFKQLALDWALPTHPDDTNNRWTKPFAGALIAFSEAQETPERAPDADIPF